MCPGKGYTGHCGISATVSFCMKVSHPSPSISLLPSGHSLALAVGGADHGCLERTGFRAKADAGHKGGGVGAGAMAG